MHIHDKETIESDHLWVQKGKRSWARFSGRVTYCKKPGCQYEVFQGNPIPREEIIGFPEELKNVTASRKAIA